MATSYVDPTIPLAAKAPQGLSSLGDMLNIARGAQAYQQAEQMNPIALRQAEAQAGAAELGLNQKQLSIVGGMLTGLENSDAFKNGDAAGMKAQLGVVQNILEANKIPTQKTFGVINDLLKNNNIEGVRSTLSNLRNGLVSNETQFSSALPQLTTSGGQPATFAQSGPQSGQIRTPNYPGVTTGQTAPPQAAPANVPAGVATGVPVQEPTTPQAAPLPNAPAGQPPAPAGGVTPQAMGMPPETVELNKPVPPQHPVRRPGAPGSTMPILANEARDTEVNLGYKNGLLSRQTELPTARRNIQETLKVAGELENQSWFKTGAPADIERKVRQFFGEERYKQLSKDLANIQISNIRAQGGSMDTVGGQQLMKLANGDETYPPKVLIGIARRADADLTNIDLQATAAARYAEKFTESNLNSFKQMWAKNADSKVFEAMNIFRDEKDPAKAKELIDNLFGNDPKQRKIYFQKYQNIQKLVKDGTL